MQQAKFISFRINEQGIAQEFGVPIEDVQEIKEMFPLVRIPNAPLFVKGVVNLRGIIVTVIDLRSRLGLPQVDYTEDTAVIVVKLGSRRLGMIVDQVEEVRTLTKDKIDKTPALIKGDLEKAFIKGVGRLDDSLLIILDLENLFNV